MGVTRIVDVDDDGTGLTGTEHNNDWLQALFDAIELNWVLDSYTPSWTASSSNPAIGNGTITGSYFRIGKLVLFAVKIVAGSTTTFGTGNYSVSLPLTANSGFPGLVNVFAQDASAGGAVYNGVGFIATSTTAGLFTTHDAAVGAYTPTVPITFAPSDVLHVFGAYFRP